MNISNIGIIGGGSWGTALVKLLTKNLDNKIHWYIRNKEDIEHIKKYKHNPRYISFAELPVEKIVLYNNILDLITSVDLIILAIPSAFLEENLSGYIPSSEKYYVSAIKGIIPQHHKTVSEFLHSKYNIPYKNLAVISGPCHAEEIVAERLSYLTVGSTNAELSHFISNILTNYYVSVKTSKDIRGIEYAGILKNIMAIAVGISHGLGYGDNFTAVLVSNACEEISIFLDKIFEGHRKITNSVYLGDLLVTAYSQFSRNRAFGTMIGKGYSVKMAQIEMNMVAEGYYATHSMKQITKKLDINLPILDAVYHILYDKVPPALEFKLLQKKLK